MHRACFAPLGSVWNKFVAGGRSIIMKTRPGALARLLSVAMVLLSLHFSPLAAAAGLESLDLQTIHKVFPRADRIGDTLDVVRARAVDDGRKLLGWVFLSDEIFPVPAYSGKPISVLVGLRPDATIAATTIIAHEEPILVIGVKDEDLHHFLDQYTDLPAKVRVLVGADDGADYRGFDAISGATITTMVLNQSLMRSVQIVATTLGLPREVTRADALRQGEATRPPESRAIPAAAPFDAGLSVDGEPEWLQLWKARWLRIGVLTTALLSLVTLLVFQDWLVVRPVLFRRVRIGFLLFTVGFIGFYCMGQLSILNMLAFAHAFSGGFSWATMLLEPVTFLLWSFVALAVVLWGRGVYCGWLCPFGASQELINTLAKRFRLPQFDLPVMVHERLWAIKYLILIALFGLSLDSMSRAATVAEVEPFKTVFALHFMRDWSYVLYALGLLLISAFNSKFYCKYLCPLGAALSFFTRFRIFDWLRRRSECGNPCQVCAKQCDLGAIRPTGEIVDNECHYCLECQVTYNDDHRCPPLVEKRKRREKREARAAEIALKQIG